MNTFSERFDSYFGARADYSDYRGYTSDGDYTYWQPQDYCDLEPLEPNFGPGAMNRYELDTFDNSDVGEF